MQDQYSNNSAAATAKAPPTHTCTYKKEIHTRAHATPTPGVVTTPCFYSILITAFDQRSTKSKKSSMGTACAWAELEKFFKASWSMIMMHVRAHAQPTEKKTVSVDGANMTCDSHAHDGHGRGIASSCNVARVHPTEAQGSSIAIATPTGGAPSPATRRPRPMINTALLLLLLLLLLPRLCRRRWCWRGCRRLHSDRNGLCWRRCFGLVFVVRTLAHFIFH